MRLSPSLAAAAALCAACQCPKSPPARFTPPSDERLLPIPDRPWEPGAPPEGFCGEASVQMAALHYGTWVPQPVANRLGRPTHPDLWEDDVPTALDALGLGYETWTGPAGDGKGELPEFLGWIVSQVRAGRPVIVGAKLFPTEHPDWDVDHLMPVVGFSPAHLVFNTNMDGGQRAVPYAALAGRAGISFASPSGRFWGFAVLGARAGAATPAVTARVVAGSDAGVELELRVTGLPAGRGAVLARDALDGGRVVTPLVPDGGVATVRATVGAGEAARFSAIPAPLPPGVGR